MKKLRKGTGARWMDPGEIPPGPTDLGRRLAGIVLARAFADPDPMTRAWFTALCKCMIHWPDPRRSQVSATAFQDSLQYVYDSGGIYYEGLVLREADEGRPQPAIWVSTPEELVCFTHDLTMPHALAGIPIADASLRSLFHCQGIPGPYLLSKSRGVLDTAVPKNLQMFGQVPPKGLQ